MGWTRRRSIPAILSDSSSLILANASVWTSSSPIHLSAAKKKKAFKATSPEDKQTSETALLFLQLIMRKLRKVGRGVPTAPPARAAVVVPNGTLFGDGV